ncbi:WAS/WASL-interacting protein family member 2 [Bufo gargarizans]|uniref:WAS/WASL-interacting protein family member 2 n=1 Tax=Bufo gargarizans TaxID=30331 RepID=UPI001CF4360D|nr:WAS/WASL-interacting protein family member 2 [Bufo gargarizans]
MPIAPPPPPGPPPPPTFSQANTEPPRLSRGEQRGRGALLNDICKGAQLKKTTVVNDRSAPVLEKPKGSSGGSGFGPTGGGALQPKGGLFQGGVPKLRPVGTKDISESPSGRSPLQGSSTRPAAPRPPVSGGRPQDDTDSSSNRSSPPEIGRAHRPSLPDLTRPPNTTSPGMKHSSSAPPPPPPGRRHASSTPSPAQSAKPYSRDKPLPPTPGHRAPAAPPVKPPPSPVNMRTPNSQGQPPPPPPYRQPPTSVNGPPSPINEPPPDLPQRHNSLHRKQPAPVRGLAPPPPSANLSPGGNRPPPPARDPPSRGAAPPPPPPIIRNGGRDAPPPPPPPYRMHGTTDTTQNRAKPPPPPSRTPSGPPPPPPPVRNGHRDSISVGRSFADDFESKYSFHSVDEFPAPEDYRPFQKIYPSKSIRVTRGAPPLPPIPR